MDEKKGRRPLAALLINIGKDKGGEKGGSKEMDAPQASACEDMIAAVKDGDAEKFGAALSDFIRLERRTAHREPDEDNEDDGDADNE